MSFLVLNLKDDEGNAKARSLELAKTVKRSTSVVQLLVDETSRVSFRRDVVFVKGEQGWYLPATEVALASDLLEAASKFVPEPCEGELVLEQIRAARRKRGARS